MAHVHIACIAPRGSHKGNRVTAERWATLLRKAGHRVVVAESWKGEPCDVLVALHATKSAGAIRAYRRANPHGPLVVLLSGTDLYGDLGKRAATLRSLETASRIVALQPLAVERLPLKLRRKAVVVLQSAVARRAARHRNGNGFDVAVLAHLRPVKDPFRAALASRRLPAESRIHILHLGTALSPSMARRARAESRSNARYRWLGDVSHNQALATLSRCQALVLSSRMEGGANAVSEAIVAGVPVLASRIAGSIGLLGDDYPAFFPVGDTKALTELLHRAETDPQFVSGLKVRLANLASQFTPEKEQAALDQLVRAVTECNAPSDPDPLEGGSSVAAEVRRGLTSMPKTLPSKLFYDEEGSKLFEAICGLPEYYLTRSERSILDREAGYLAATTKASDVIELGPGDAGKTRLLLDALTHQKTLRRYCPIDISQEMLESTARNLRREYPGLGVQSIAADYDKRIPLLPPPLDNAPRLLAFLGSTIGNYPPGEAEAFLARIAERLRSGDYLLLGADLVKDRRVLVAAYDDSAGVTARFNRNALVHLNRLFEADFVPSRFEHCAVWNEEQSQIEMHLRSLGSQQVYLKRLDLRVAFADREMLRTEISRKYTRASIERMLTQGGFVTRDWLTSTDDAFALTLATKG